ncbi:hypothetical protein PV08_10766 [Exophiala spinifera]|uniref:Xylanolytic transcriptional activator regulatory domain-containing protein n=1 Tax=Exophiala spinifera TaxID=91928 RepID=A0A0D1Y920_9EURO|nr:uncharacterized protein PV08_10766 [Exophiala spinifera]KIW11466.1 hypothetical protein PV08_10766 [Exophiala spinifera]
MEFLLETSALRQEGIAAPSTRSPRSSALSHQPAINAAPVAAPSSNPLLSNDKPTFAGHRAQQVAEAVLPSSTTSPEQSLANNGISILPTSAEDIPLVHFHEGKVQCLRDSMLRSKPSRLEFISMLPKTEALLLVESFIEDVNKVFPLFHVQSLKFMCRHKYPVDADSVEPAWWACLNAIIAMEIQLKISNSTSRAVAEFSWSFFKNAFFVLTELITDSPSILAVQAVLVMATFMSGTTDLQTSTFLTSSAIRMMQTIGLDKEDLGNRLSAIEKEQRRRIFWIAFLLDGATSLNLGLPPVLDFENVRINLPTEDSPDGLGTLFNSDGTGSVNIFRLRVELAIIRSKIYKRLFSQDVTGVTGHYAQNQVSELQYELRVWKEKIPAEIQLDHASQTGGETRELPVVMLQFEFHHCMDLINRTATARHSSQELLRRGAFCTDAARKTLRLLDFVGCPPFSDLWRALPYPLCATITLLAEVLARPAGTQAAADVSLIGSFLRFLKNIQQKEGYDITRFVGGCAVLNDAAKAAIARTQAEGCIQTEIEVRGDATQSPVDPVSDPTIQAKLTERLLSWLQKFPSYMHLAHGLMGNMPRLTYAASLVLSDIFRGFDGNGAPFQSFASETLMPSTYGLGSATSQVPTSAVHPHADTCENTTQWELLCR